VLYKRSLSILPLHQRKNQYFHLLYVNEKEEKYVHVSLCAA
jgi:hypothetical protein